MRCTSLTLSRGAVHHWIIWLARMTHSGFRHRYDKTYDTIYDMSEREMERTGLHWLSWCHIPVRLLDYRRAWILCSNHQHQEIAPHIVQQIQRKNKTNKTKDADAVTCVWCWASPASEELICSAGEPFQRVSEHTPVCSASHPPLTNLTHFSGLHRHLHTDLEGDTLSLVCLTRDVMIYR